MLTEYIVFSALNHSVKVCELTQSNHKRLKFYIKFHKIHQGKSLKLHASIREEEEAIPCLKGADFISDVPTTYTVGYSGGEG